MSMINRDEYIDFLARHRDRQIIKVVSGVRRCGKSTLFTLFQVRLRAEGVEERAIQVINFEDLANEPLLEYHALYKHIKDRLVDGMMNYIFLDEIQHVPHFEKAVDSLFIQPNVDLYLTGSNGYFMSGELATLLSGRYVELHMLPLSFYEYCSGANIEWRSMTLREQYEAYTTESSFPYTVQLSGRPQEIKEYLTGIYHTVILKDIVTRLSVSDVARLESVTKYIFANIGSQMSLRKIANAMSSLGRKIDGKTIEKYVRGLEDGLLLYQANRFDLKGKDVLQLNPKYYVVDPALRLLLVGTHGADTGHILENVVYLELLRRGYDVYVGAITDGEVDFVAKKGSELHYYQVAVTTMDEHVLKRELKSLQRIHDQYPKTLLTLDEIQREADFHGIKKKNVLDWLLKK